MLLVRQLEFYAKVVGHFNLWFKTSSAHTQKATRWDVDFHEIGGGWWGL